MPQPACYSKSAQTPRSAPMIGESLLAAARARQVEAEQAEEALQDGPARHAERPAAELGVPRRAGQRVVVDEQVQLSRAGLVSRRLLDSGPIDTQLHELLLDPLPQCREEEGQLRPRRGLEA